MTKKFCDICGIELDEKDRGMRKWSWVVSETSTFRSFETKSDPFTLDFCEPCYCKLKDTIKDLVKKEWGHDNGEVS